MQTSSTARNISLKILQLGLIVAPFVFLLFMVNRNFVDILFWDEWDFVPTLARSYQGTLSFTDLWMQHNEHRPLLLRLVLLFLTRLSGWNTAFEIGFSILLALLLFGVILYQLSMTGRTLKINFTWLIPMVSLIVFSLVQAENWLWGWELVVFLNVVAVTAGIVLLHQLTSWVRFLFALLCGIMATYSFATGILYWLIGLPIIILIAFGNKKLMLSRLGVWSIAAGLTIFSYLYDYRTPSYHPSPLLALEQPIQYVTYVLAYLGVPLTNGSVECVLRNVSCRETGISSALVGSAGLIVFLALLLALRQHIQWVRMMPYISLASFAILSALLTGIGRVGFGFEQAITSRYTTISSLFWIALAALVFMLAETVGAHQPMRLLSYGGTLILVSLVIQNSLSWQTYFESRHDELLPVRSELLSLTNDDLLRRITHTPDYVRGLVPVLQKYHLSVYRIP